MGPSKATDVMALLTEEMERLRVKTENQKQGEEMKEEKGEDVDFNFEYKKYFEFE